MKNKIQMANGPLFTGFQRSDFFLVLYIFQIRTNWIGIMGYENTNLDSHNFSQRRRIVQKDGGARSNIAGVICPPWSE